VTATRNSRRDPSPEGLLWWGGPGRFASHEQRCAESVRDRAIRRRALCVLTRPPSRLPVSARRRSLGETVGADVPRYDRAALAANIGRLPRRSRSDRGHLGAFHRARKLDRPGSSYECKDVSIKFVRTTHRAVGGLFVHTQCFTRDSRTEARRRGARGGESPQDSSWRSSPRAAHPLGPSELRAYSDQGRPPDPDLQQSVAMIYDRAPDGAPDRRPPRRVPLSAGTARAALGRWRSRKSSTPPSNRLPNELDRKGFD